MKKTLSLILFAAAVLAGCQKNLIEATPEENNSGEQVTIVAYLDDATKLSLVEDTKLAWAKGDQIKIGNNKIFTVDSVDVTNPMRAFFTGTAPTTAETYRAFYPASSYSSIAGRFVLLDTQNYGLDNKVTNVNYMYAVTTDYNEIHFHNVCGLLAIDLKGEGTVSNIKVTADQNLSGTLNGMSISEAGALTYTGWYSSNSSKPATYVNLGCGKVATLSKDAARRFYIAVPEADYTNLKLAVTTDQGTMVVPATKTASVKKNNIYHLPEITVDIKPLEFKAQVSVDKCETTGPANVELSVSVVPQSKDVYYIMDVKSATEVSQYADAWALAKAHLDYFKSLGGTSLQVLINSGVIYQGDELKYNIKDNGFIDNLDPNTDYVFYVYRVDENLSVSEAIKVSFHTPAFELPVSAAAYENYLGEWKMGSETITIAEKVNGSSYSVSGLSMLSVDELFTIPSFEAKFEKGNFVIYEQATGITVPLGSYGPCNLFIAGVLSGENVSEYPFTTDVPSMILYGQFKDDEINLDSAFGSLGVSWQIVDPLYEGNGNTISTALITKKLTKPVEVPDEIVGTWVCPSVYEYADYVFYNEWYPKTYTNWTWNISKSADGKTIIINGFDIGLTTTMAGYGIEASDVTANWDAKNGNIVVACGTESGANDGYNIVWKGTDDPSTSIDTRTFTADIIFHADFEKGTITPVSPYFLSMGKEIWSLYVCSSITFTKKTAVASSANVSEEKPLANIKADGYSKRSPKLKASAIKKANTKKYSIDLIAR